jgi:hypothetical protein
MAYNIKDVFYLSTNVTIAATTAGGGSSQLDLSAYIDPIARGRTKGTGLAIYKVQYSMTDDTASDPPNVNEAGTARVGMIAGLGVGDNATGALTPGIDLMRADNALAVDLQDYYGPASVPSGSSGMFTTLLEPSEDVPYVIVRDNVCLVYSLGSQMTNGSFLSVRLSCAQITLDQATLNQLLRTQTV